VKRESVLLYMLDDVPRGGGAYLIKSHPYTTDTPRDEIQSPSLFNPISQSPLPPPSCVWPGPAQTYRTILPPPKLSVESISMGTDGSPAGPRCPLPPSSLIDAMHSVTFAPAAHLRVTNEMPNGPGCGLISSPPLCYCYSSAATLGKISNKLNRQPSDLAYDYCSCCQGHGVIHMGLLRPPPPLELRFFVIHEFLFVFLGISKPKRKDMWLFLLGRFPGCS
jgi:hypothetical protein